jgi:hypothetical protein
MFVIMGKMTSMAETMKDFPAVDRTGSKNNLKSLMKLTAQSEKLSPN